MSGSPPEVSIVVPVYNGATTLPECLASIAASVTELPLAQRDAIEVVVCDNHSTDASREQAESVVFGCRSRVVQPPAHLTNRTENWRYGLGQARGTWMAMLHADDALVSGGLAAWVKAVASPLAAGVSFISGRHHTFEHDLGTLDSARPRFASASIMRGAWLNAWVMPLICPFVPFVLMRRACYEALGGLDASLELTQDWELWVRMCGAGDVLAWPGPVGAWRRHPTSAAYQRRNMQEYLRMHEVLAPAAAPGIAALARAGVAARIATTMAGDDTPEADALREQARQLAPRAVRRPAPWLRAASAVASANLVAIRVAGVNRGSAVRGPSR